MGSALLWSLDSQCQRGVRNDLLKSSLFHLRVLKISPSASLDIRRMPCSAEFRAFLPAARAYPLIQNSRLSISLFLFLILRSSDCLSLHHVPTCTEEVVFATWGPFLCAGVQFNRHLRNVPNPIPKPKHVRSCKTCLHLKLPITEVVIQVFPNLTLNPTPTPPL